MTDSTVRAERIKPQPATMPGYLWEVPQKPVAVQLSYGMIDRLEKETVENFRSLTSRGSEIGGLLLGTVGSGNPAVVAVDDFELIPCDYSRGPLYRLSDADMGRFEYAMQQRLNEKGLLVVGYFRSHTRKGLSLDAEDVAFLEARFRDAHQVALLVRPYATKASTAGIFIREDGVLHGDASYMEFPFRSSQLSSYRPSPLLAEAPPAPPPTAAMSTSGGAPLPAAPKPAARAQIVPIASRREISLPAPPPAAEPPAKTPPTAAAPAAPVAPAEPAKVAAKAEPAAPAEPAKPAAKPAAKEVVKEKEAEKAAAVAEKPPAKVEPAKQAPKQAEPKPAEKAAAASPVTQEKSKAPMVAGIVAAIVFILVGLFVYPGFLKHGSIPTSGQSGLSLSTERTGADILVTWNRNSDAVKNAARAVLFIFDGDRHETYEMDPGQLRDGKIMYSPITADVSFRLDVTPQGKSTPVTDSVRVLRTRPSPMGEDGQPTQAGTPAKPGATPQPATAATTDPKNATPTTSEPVDTAATEEAKPKVSAAPAKPFDASSLVQRLRPVSASETLEAPSISPGVASPAGSGSLAGLNLNSSAPAPLAPPPPSTPERKATSVSGGQIRTAELITRKEPEYPKLARQMGVKGVVELTATIGIDGRVKSVKVEKGHPLLTKAASDAVMQWVYRPTLLNGQPVQNDTKITLNFLGER